MEVLIGTPDNVCEVYVNDFGDHYHRTNDAPLTELEQQAMRIRRRYKDVLEYINAVNIYREYMTQLLNKYGNEKLLRVYLKYKTLEEYIPPVPRMKNTKFNKYILKHQLLLSPIDASDISNDVIDIINSQQVEDVEMKAEKLKDKELLEFIENELDSYTLKKFRNISDIDYLEEYFMNKNKSKKKQEQRKLPPLKEILSGEYYNKYKDTRENDEIIYYRGQYLKRTSVDELVMFDQMTQLGWDGIKLMKKAGASKRATKLMKEQAKKHKKKKKKKKNKDVDDFLVKVLGDNNYDDFEDFEKEMLNFTSANIFK